MRWRLFSSIVPLLFWTPFILSQSLNISLNRPWDDGVQFVHQLPVIIKGIAKTQVNGDSLIFIRYRFYGQTQWQHGQWLDENVQQRQFVIQLSLPDEGFSQVELSLITAKFQRDSVFKVVQFILDLTPPNIQKAPTIFQQLTPLFSPEWRLNIVFSEPLLQWQREKFRVKWGNEILSGEEIGRWEAVSATRWQVFINATVQQSMLRWLLKGNLLKGEIEPEALVDLAGNVNPDTLKFTLTLLSDSVLTNIFLENPAIRPVGDTLNLSFDVLKTATVFAILTTIPEGKVIYQTAISVIPGDGQLVKNPEGNFFESQDGHCFFKWWNNISGTPVGEGKYQLVFYSQLTGQPGYVDFHYLYFYIDGSPPLIQRMLPATGSSQHAIDHQPKFLVYPQEDSTQSPVISCIGKFSKVLLANGIMEDSITLEFQRSLGGSYFVLDFKELGFRLPEGDQTLQLVLTDQAGNTGVYTHHFAVITDTSQYDITDVYNYPNPFNPYQGQSTVIAFFTYLREPVQLQLFDFSGQLIFYKTYSGMQIQGRGRRVIQWDGYDLTGKVVPSGVYWGQIIIGSKKSPIFRIAVLNQ